LNLSNQYSAINCIEEDSNGRLWLGTNDGLVRFDPKTHEKRIFTFEDGLPDNEFNRGASYRAKDGTLFFGGPKGVVYFHPDSIESNPYRPRVLLSAVHVSGAKYTDSNQRIRRTIRPDTLFDKTEIDLPYNDNDISFDFGIIHNAAPEKNRLRYKLKGFDLNWKTAFSTQRSAEYTDLRPGTYTFQLKGENGDYEKSIGNTELVITINPPFWNMVWFRSFLILVLLTGIYVWYRYRTKVLRDQKIDLEKEVALRTVQLHEKNDTLSYQKEEILQLANKLQKANESQLHFFTNISHELRTPLTLILGPVETLLNDPSLNAHVRNQLSFVQRNSNRLLSLTNELLYIRKLASGGVSLHVERFDINEIIRTIYGSFNSLAIKKNITFEYSVNCTSSFGFVDVEKLTKILNNLLDNAFKYTPDGGTIEVITTFLGDNISIIVKDSGIGISKENQLRVFERFCRGEKASSQNPDGAGIGLALVKELVLLHKGEITVQSKLGKGTSFTVCLPIAESYDSKKEQRTMESSNEAVLDVLSETANNIQKLLPAKGKTTFKKTVLLVEDNSDMREYIYGILEKQYKVITAEDGAKALEILEKSIVDLVISDVMMPNMNGFELCQKVKVDIRTSHIPIILLTAKTAEYSQLKGLGIGADDYVTKPFKTNIILLKIRNIMSAREKFKERFNREALAQPSEIELTEKDEIFLSKAIAVVEKNISDSTFNVARFSKIMGMSRPVLNKKLTALTDLAPSKFIRHIRLKRAAVLIKNNQGSIQEIMYETGFTSSSYFAKIFKKTFGINPLDYLKAEVS